MIYDQCASILWCYFITHQPTSPGCRELKQASCRARDGCVVRGFQS